MCRWRDRPQHQERNTAGLALVLCESYVRYELALGGMTGNMPLARRILSQHDAPRRETADVAIACLKLNLTG